MSQFSDDGPSQFDPVAQVEAAGDEHRGQGHRDEGPRGLAKPPGSGFDQERLCAEKDSQKGQKQEAGDLRQKSGSKGDSEAKQPSGGPAFREQNFDAEPYHAARQGGVQGFVGEVRGHVQIERKESGRQERESGDAAKIREQPTCQHVGDGDLHKAGKKWNQPHERARFFSPEAVQRGRGDIEERRVIHRRSIGGERKREVLTHKVDVREMVGPVEARVERKLAGLEEQNGEPQRQDRPRSQCRPEPGRQRKRVSAQ